jgi:hypothetical protein
MVLSEYSNKKKEGKDSIDTIMSLIEFPLLDQTSSNSVISTTPNELFYLVLLVISGIRDTFRNKYIAELAMG